MSPHQSAQTLGDGFFDFDFVWPLEPIENSGEFAIFNVSSYLRNAFGKTKPNLMICVEALSQVQ